MVAKHRSPITETRRHGSRLLHVGQVDLERGQAGDLQRVADRPRVVGPRAGVQEDRVGVRAQRVQVLDELALVVGVEEARGQAQRARVVLDPLLELSPA